MRSIRSVVLGFVLAGCAISAFAANATQQARSGAVVAADGSSDYRSVQEALAKAPQGTDAAHPWVILVKSGTYHELVQPQREKRFVILRGEDPLNTTVTYDLYAGTKGPDGKGIGTFRTATVTVDADDFAIENLTLVNSAGPVGQALALRVDGDRCVFRRCRFIGWQDTILTNRGRQYFEECTIAGATDFIFGGGTAFFERCDLHILGTGFITAASTPDIQPFGLVFSHCRVLSDRLESRTYLGRPWRGYAATVWLNTEMGEVVNPAGWHNWGSTEKEKRVRYAEYASTGSGGDGPLRVPWAKRLTEEQARGFSMEMVLAGTDGWRPVPADLPAAGVPMPTTLPFEIAKARRATTGPTTSPVQIQTSVPPPIPPLTGAFSLWSEERVQANPATRPERDDGTGRIWDVSVPGILVYLPTQRPPEGGRTAIIFCAGGGYTHLTRLVGADGVAGTFVPRGVAVISLKYRLKPPSTDVEADTLADGRRAIRYVRAHAAEWGINPHRVGLLGCSAGANLALNVATHPDSSGVTVDDIDRQSDRPDFVALLSPWPAGHDAADYPVTTTTSPSFILTALDDRTAPPAFALKIAAAYAEAKVPVNVWVVEHGGHSAFTTGGVDEGAQWPARLWDWLKRRELINDK